MACSSKGLIAYTAGTSVVVYDAKQRAVEFQVTFPAGNSISTVAFSPDGKYLCAAQAEVVAELQHHKFGVNCVAFSPNSKLVVSVGSPHDGSLIVWDWKANKVVGAAKLDKRPIHSISFNADGKSFVTAGECHAQFWTTETRGTTIKSGIKNDSFPLIDGVSAIDPDEEGKGGKQTYRDITFGTGSTANIGFGISDKGRLVMFQNRRLDRYLDVKSKCGLALSAGESVVAVGCVDGIVRLFHPSTLEYYQSVPKHKLADGSSPDTAALRLINGEKTLIVLYTDSSLFHYNLDNLKAPTPEFWISKDQWNLTVAEEEEADEESAKPIQKKAEETFDIDDIFADLDDQPAVAGKWAERAEEDGNHNATFKAFAGSADNRRFTIEPQQLQAIQMAVAQQAAAPSTAEIEAKIRKELEAKMAAELKAEREKLAREQRKLEETRKQLAAKEADLAAKQSAAQAQAAQQAAQQEAQAVLAVQAKEEKAVPVQASELVVAVETPLYVGAGDLDEEIEAARLRIAALGGVAPAADEHPEPQPDALAVAFRKTLNIYEELKEDGHPATAHFEAVFQNVINKMPETVSTKSEGSTLSAENLEPLLSKYSELLLQTVAQKMANKQ